MPELTRAMELVRLEFQVLRSSRYRCRKRGGWGWVPGQALLQAACLSLSFTQTLLPVWPMGPFRCNHATCRQLSSPCVRVLQFSALSLF